MTDLHRVTGDQLTVAQLYAVLTLRVNVFVVEQRSPYPDLDGRDLRPDTVHYWWAPGDEPVAYLRLLTEPDGALRIGRVCVAPDARGTGLGSRLTAAALADIGDRDAVLDAQTAVRDLYARFGFEPVGEPYDDFGVPHVMMRRPGQRVGRSG
ncbi:MAG TPA: GNAT family N-acetyltransferase [Actinophytocola sp.]|uniref:GNAT family N-acetyltransferase n=1 Tax=Actinophytocola sp. TaxID=1872138 RepID=UPI002DBCB729|nr:GNAT family N-acetyltransferase [Actinophytocola sp.]HEU5470493.1 GNAT family N-acetyltransferase [Actinophytocola sp.]